jgi:hypothetical protein
MAQRLIERWRLAVLQVRLDVSRPTPVVEAELVGYPDGNKVTFWQQSHHPAAFGLPDGTAAPTALHVPDDLRQAVAAFLDGVGGREAALWLRLVPPYGYLGAVPWEEELVAETGVPIVRVPDRLPPAADPGHVWNVAIAISAQPGSTWAAPYLTALMAALRNAVPARIDVDIFADAATHTEIGAALQETAADDSAVRVHNPYNARPAYDERSAASMSQFRSPRRASRISSSAPQPGLLWRDWITAGLAGRAVRALHVIADAVFDGGRPLLAVSPDPIQAADSSTCAYVGPEDVRGLADVLGAAALSFGSPPGNPSDMATRVMADAVGQRRPGATLYSSIRLDPAGYALAQAHAFIASSQPGQEPIPRDPSLFAYLQPESVKGSLQEPWPFAEPQASEKTRPDPGVSSYYAETDVVPAWLAATERYIESNVARLAATSAGEGKVSSTKQAYELGTEDALAELRALTNRHLGSS